MNLFITSMSLAWTCGSSTKEIILPRLKYIGEFLFTSPKQSKMNLLCSLSGAHLRTTSVEWSLLNFRPYTKLLWWLDLFMGLPYTTFFRPRFGRYVCDCSLFIHVLDEEFVIGTTSIRPWLRRMFLGLHPVLSFRRVYLGVYFSFSSQTHGRYILASKEFICPCLFALRGSFWINA